VVPWVRSVSRAPGDVGLPSAPMSRHRVRYLLSLTVAIAACASLLATGATAGPAPAPPGGDLLPDLDQQTPSGLMVSLASAHGPARYVLGFQSAVRNIGDGPFIIAGSRPNRRTPLMRATQLIDRADGTQHAVQVAARLRYAISPDHQHWHLLHFDRYELRHAGRGGVLVRDQKTGFCLGDRYRVVGHDVPAALAQPTYTDRCGLTEPWLLRVREGISPGYGDNYLPYLEGQSLPLTGLPAGRYVLTHRTNSDRTLRESNYANDAASVLLDLRWQHSQPEMTVVRTCPDTARCDKLPAGAGAARARPVPRGTISALWDRGSHPGANWALCGLTGLTSKQ
jgi:Lysyl oxidase